MNAILRAIDAANESLCLASLTYSVGAPLSIRELLGCFCIVRKDVGDLSFEIAMAKVSGRGLPPLHGNQESDQWVQLC